VFANTQDLTSEKGNLVAASTVDSAMNHPTISATALRLLELIQSNAVLRTAVEDRPDLLTLFIRAANVAAKMSADRARIVQAVTSAADASDRAVEAIRDGKVGELADLLLKAGHEIESLAKLLKEFDPIAAAVSDEADKASN
jgi:hypothetical protein